MIKETYNLIILDRSGSMSSIRNQAIGGVNETFDTIRRLQKTTEVKQFVSFTSFCSCSMHNTYDCVPIDEVSHITPTDYSPCCCTPLYDAIGQCCMRLKQHLASRQDCAVSVTIITDGYENASKEWSAASIRSLIEMLKKEGWLFAYIGANQDLAEVTFNLSIENTLSFAANESGTAEMFKKERRSRERWMNRLTQDDCAPCRCMNGYFDE